MCSCKLSPASGLVRWEVAWRKEPLGGSCQGSRDLRSSVGESGWPDGMLLRCWCVTSIRYQWGWSWGRLVQGAMGKIEGVVGRGPVTSCVLCTALSFLQCVSTYISTYISIHNWTGILQWSAPGKIIVLISCPLCFFSSFTESGNLRAMVNNRSPRTN